MKISTYFKPKTFIYTGEHTDVQTQIIHYQYDEKSLEMIDGFESIKDKKHYIQVIGLSNIKKIQDIKNYFSIDALVLEDIFNVNQRNKFELKENYVFGTFSLSYIEHKKIHKSYMSLLMFSNAIISFHETPPVFLDDINQLIKDHKDLRELPIDYLLFQLLDIITDHHLEVYDVLDEAINTFESQILETKNIEQESFYLIRKNMLNLKTNVSPVLEQLEKILNKKSALFNPMTNNYYDDLKDHLQRLDNRLNQSRETIHHLLDLHMNNQSTKMNKIMATLTLFSAIFIPLSFLTGFFGMNFVHFGLLEYEHGLLILSAVSLSIALGMMIFFKTKKWF